ncbi:MAG TPA: hypothetical protein VNW94_24330, partial [Streptosporangiaceae bacterium]|nr:hypothetical protein [Streptosporangiaceae bacterium]
RPRNRRETPQQLQDTRLNSLNQKDLDPQVLTIAHQLQQVQGPMRLSVTCRRDDCRPWYLLYEVTADAASA